MSNKGNKPPIVILILIYAILLYASYNSLSVLALGLWGESVMGTVDSYDNRLDNTNAEVNRSRTVSKGYSFTVNGKEYRGYVIYQSDEAWPRLEEGETRSERIRYLAFLPYINKPAMLADFDEIGVRGLLYHIFLPVGCLLLFLLVSGKLKFNKKRKKAYKNPKNDNEDMSETLLQENTSENEPNLIGFSQRNNHEEILAAAQKNRKIGYRFIIILVLLPLLGFPLAGLLIEDFSFGESVVIGIGVALIFLIFNLISLQKYKKPTWEGKVVNKYSKERYEHRGNDDSNGRTYTEYTTLIMTDAGKKKTIVEKDSRRDMFDYLSVGDKVRFHPMFGTYEKYDKSKDSVIYCNVCTIRNPISNDRCKKCDNLLFK